MVKRPGVLWSLGVCAALFLSTACSGQTGPGSAAAIPPANSLVRVNPDNTYYGCPVFKTGSAYNKVVTGAAVDPHSADYIKSVVQAGDTYSFYASTGVEQINLANNNTPMVTVQQKVQYHQFPAKYPWQSSFYIEPLGDHHAMVVQTQSCRVYEAYDTTYAYGTLSAYSGANWNMKDRFVPLQPGNPSSMASGLSLFAGMVKWEDYQSGSITHALNWDGIQHTVAQYDFVKPASDAEGLPFYGSSSYQLPYGARLRLKASFNMSGWGPQATMVGNAMKTYGIFLSDTGSNGNGIYFANAADGSDPWSWSDLNALSNVHISDFDVVKLPAIQSTK
jgi:hypothetical protein